MELDNQETLPPAAGGVQQQGVGNIANNQHVTNTYNIKIGPEDPPKGAPSWQWGTILVIVVLILALTVGHPSPPVEKALVTVLQQITAHGGH